MVLLGVALGVALAYGCGGGAGPHYECRGVVAPPAGTCNQPFPPAWWAVGLSALVPGLSLTALVRAWSSRFFLSHQT